MRKKERGGDVHRVMKTPFLFFGFSECAIGATIDLSCQTSVAELPGEKKKSSIARVMQIDDKTGLLFSHGPH
jgi:hypothetical protein